MFKTGDRVGSLSCDWLKGHVVAIVVMPRQDYALVHWDCYKLPDEAIKWELCDLSHTAQ